MVSNHWFEGELLAYKLDIQMVGNVWDLEALLFCQTLVEESVSSPIEGNTSFTMRVAYDHRFAVMWVFHFVLVTCVALAEDDDILVWYARFHEFAMMLGIYICPPNA
jgi:hypothetical protein